MKNKWIFVLLLGISWGVLAEEEQNAFSSFVEPLEECPYTWSDFLMGKSCSSFLNGKQTEAISTSLTQMMHSYCAQQPIRAWADLLTTFRQNKRDLLINETLKKGHPFFRYLKVLPILLFDVSHLSPTGQTLSDQLDRIQQAIQNKDPEQVLFLMQDLSPNQQLFLLPVFNEAQRLFDFQKLLQGKGKHE